MPITFTRADLDIDQSVGIQGDEIATTSLPSAYQYLLSLTGGGAGVASAFPQVAHEANFLSLSVPSGTTVSDLVWMHPTSSTDPTLVPFSTTTGFATTLQDVNAPPRTIYLFLDPTNSNVLLGRTGSTASSPLAFAIVLDEAANDQSAGGYIVLYEAMKHPITTNPNDVIDLLNQVYVSAATTTSFSFSDFSDVQSGNTEFALIGPDAGQPTGTNIIATGDIRQGSQTENTTVNVSTRGLGAGSQSVGQNAALQLDFVTGNNTTTPPNTTGDADDLSYVAHVENVTEAQFSLTQVNPTNTSGDPTQISLTVSAWNATGNVQGGAFLDSPATNVNITQVQVFDAAGTLIEDSDGTPNSSGVSATINQGTGDAAVTGLLVDYTVKVFSTGMDRITVTNTDSSKNDSFDVGEIQFNTTSTGTDNVEVGSFINIFDDGPSLATDITGGTVAFASGQSVSDTYTSGTGTDGGAGVKIENNFTDLAGFTETLSSDGKTLTYSQGTTPVFRLTVDDDSYNFEVLQSQQNTTRTLDFGAIAAGGPKELIDVPTTDGVDIVRFDGLIFPSTSTTTDPLAPGNNPGPSNPADDANPDSLGFGVKATQASQMNDNEGFSADLIQPASGEFSKFSFDIQGIGGVKTVNVTYWLVDEGVVLDLNPNTPAIDGKTTTVQLPTGNNTKNFVIDPLTEVGKTVDQIYVAFDLPRSNDGVRVLNFQESQAVTFPPQTMTFQLSNTDADGDKVLSNTFTITADPSVVPFI